MIKVQLVHVPGCTHCGRAKKIIEDLKTTYPQLELVDIDATTPEGMELVTKYGVMASPGVILNGELFATGGLDRNKFQTKLATLA